MHHQYRPAGHQQRTRGRQLLVSAFPLILFRKTNFHVHGAALAKRTLLPVGPAYLSHVRRSVNDHSFEEHDRHLEEERKRHEELHGVGEEDDLGVGEEEETPDLLALDPKEWKVSRTDSFLGRYLMRRTETRPLCRHGFVTLAIQGDAGSNKNCPYAIPPSIWKKSCALCLH